MNSWRSVTSQNNHIWKWIVSLWYPYMANSWRHKPPAFNAQVLILSCYLTCPVSNATQLVRSFDGHRSGSEQALHPYNWLASMSLYPSVHDLHSPEPISVYSPASHVAEKYIQLYEFTTLQFSYCKLLFHKYMNQHYW